MRQQEEDGNIEVVFERRRSGMNEKGIQETERKKKVWSATSRKVNDSGRDEDYKDDISRSSQKAPSKRWTLKSLLNRNSNSSFSEKILQKWLPQREKETFKSEASLRRRAEKGKSRMSDVPNNQELPSSSGNNGTGFYSNERKNFNDVDYVYYDKGADDNDEDNFESCTEDELFASGNESYYENADGK
jgi:hypothetical protein